MSKSQKMTLVKVAHGVDGGAGLGASRDVGSLGGRV